MSIQLSQQQREDIRHAALKFLADRPKLPFGAEPIARLMYRKGLLDFDPPVEAVEAALRLLQGMELVEEIVDPLGASLYYRATAKGILQYERETKG